MTWVREEAEHAEEDEGAHCAAVVVAGNSGCCGVEEVRDVGVGLEGGEGGAGSVVVEVDWEEGLFVADVEEA